jgi:hypothetical protein
MAKHRGRKRGPKKLTVVGPHLGGRHKVMEHEGKSRRKEGRRKTHRRKRA